MSHRKTDLGIPRRSKSAKVVLGILAGSPKALLLQMNDEVQRWSDTICIRRRKQITIRLFAALETMRSGYWDCLNSTWLVITEKTPNRDTRRTQTVSQGR
jgi:hypothetical protein